MNINRSLSCDTQQQFTAAKHTSRTCFLSATTIASSMNLSSGCWSWAPPIRRFTLLRIRYGNNRSCQQTVRHTYSRLTELRFNVQLHVIHVISKTLLALVQRNTDTQRGSRHRLGQILSATILRVYIPLWHDRLTAHRLCTSAANDTSIQHSTASKLSKNLPR